MRPLTVGVGGASPRTLRRTGTPIGAAGTGSENVAVPLARQVGPSLVGSRWRTSNSIPGGWRGSSPRGRPAPTRVVFGDADGAALRPEPAHRRPASARAGDRAQTQRFAVRVRPIRSGSASAAPGAQARSAPPAPTIDRPCPPGRR